ncbi:MAG: hypothetical protein HY903_11390 [Deltaproteobacteria bacterium]|nr:hypothetical protein [Deltaproteobacteria bacterium]
MDRFLAVGLLGLLGVFGLAACAGTDLRPTARDVETDAALDFGEAYVGDTVPASFSVRATGTGHVVVVSVTAADPSVAIRYDQDPSDTRGTPVGPGEALLVEVVWAPAFAGELASIIEVSTNVGGKERLPVGLHGVAKPLPDCDDLNPCTDDRFNRETLGCEHSNNAATCDDINACTDLDRCFDGACRGVAKRCFDDDVCTLDLCDPAVGCVFPPDQIVCDDRDPCTRDECDAHHGCSHPDADDGTPCGMFSCSEAHVCFAGDCRALDVGSVTDGLPCTDGNPCTEDDTCQGGECQAGPYRIREPQIVGYYETYGGEGSKVATDGYRFLFADGDALRLALLTGSAGLTHVTTVPARTGLAPVLVEPGKFVIASGDRLALLDATDPTAPRFVWEVTHPYLADCCPTVIAQLASVAGGVVYWVRYGGAAGLGVERYLPSQGGDGPFFLPLAAADLQPGALVTLAHDLDVRDLDADQSSVAWVSATAMHYLRLSQTGAVSLQAQTPNIGLATLKKVSVQGDTVAVLGAHGIEVYTMQTAPVLPPAVGPDTCPGDYYVPGCGEPALPAGCYFPCNEAVVPSPCPFGFSCQSRVVDPCWPGDCDACGMQVELCIPEPVAQFSLTASYPDYLADDLALQNGILSVVSERGVEATVPSGYLWGVPIYIGWQLQDSIGGDRLDHGPGYLLLGGPIALPLARAGWPIIDGPGVSEDAVAPNPQIPALFRVTGARHGNVRGLVDGGGTEIFVAGRAAWGRIDLLAESVTAWSLTATAASPQRPRVVFGALRDAVIVSEPAPWYPTALAVDGSASVEIMDAGGGTETRVLDGLYGGSIEALGTRVWAMTPFAPDIMNCTPPAGFRVWDLVSAAAPVPTVFERQLADSCGDPMAWTTRLRLSDDGRKATLLTAASDYACPGVPGTPTGVCYAAPFFQVSTYDVLSPGAAPTSSFVVGGVHDGGRPRRDRFATDGDTILLGEAQRAALYDPAGVTDLALAPAVSLSSADPSDPVRVLWMKDGRAWLGWNTGDPVTQDLLPGPQLTQVSYDLGAMSVTDAGGLPLPAPADSVVDLELYTVALTAAGVVVVAPACR